MHSYNSIISIHSNVNEVISGKNTQVIQHNNNSKSSNTGKTNPNNGGKHNKNRRHHKNHHHKAPAWDMERKGAPITVTKADLMEILEGTNPEELLMSSIVDQNKELKSMALKKPAPQETDENLELDDSKIKINIANTCPICDKPIREIMYALHDYDHDKLAHFDCVYKKVLSDSKDKLTEGRYLAYLGSGSFGVMEQKNKKQITLIEKIYPGAPLEELLHSDENIEDEEL